MKNLRKFLFRDEPYYYQISQMEPCKMVNGWVNLTVKIYWKEKPSLINRLFGLLWANIGDCKNCLSKYHYHRVSFFDTAIPDILNKSSEEVESFILNEIKGVMEKIYIKYKIEKKTIDVKKTIQQYSGRVGIIDCSPEIEEIFKI